MWLYLGCLACLWPGGGSTGSHWQGARKFKHAHHRHTFHSSTPKGMQLVIRNCQAGPCPATGKIRATKRSCLLEKKRQKKRANLKKGRAACARVRWKLPLASGVFGGKFLKSFRATARDQRRESNRHRVGPFCEPDDWSYSLTVQQQQQPWRPRGIRGEAVPGRRISGVH